MLTPINQINLSFLFSQNSSWLIIRSDRMTIVPFPLYIKFILLYHIQPPHFGSGTRNIKLYQSCFSNNVSLLILFVKDGCKVRSLQK